MKSPLEGLVVVATGIIACIFLNREMLPLFLSGAALAFAARNAFEGSVSSTVRIVMREVPVFQIDEIHWGCRYGIIEHRNNTWFILNTSAKEIAGPYTSKSEAFVMMSALAIELVKNESFG